MPGIDAFLHLRRLLPADLPNWERNDGLEPSAPLTVFCQNEPNRYWTEAPTAVDGCHRNIGARKGNKFICYPMGILKNGVWLQARVPLRMEVIDPLTGKRSSSGISVSANACIYHSVRVPISAEGRSTWNESSNAIVARVSFTWFRTWAILRL